MPDKNIYKVTSELVSDEVIRQKKLFNVFVFGLPRSGTSMMTHICELLGVQMIHTSEEKKNDFKRLGKYHPNKTGFYEITKNPLTHYLKIMSTPYSGCKMIVPVNDLRFELVKILPSKVIFMWRDPEEIRQSQNAYYSPQNDVAYLRTSLASQSLRLKENNIDFIKILYSDVINNTKETITTVKDFIHSDVSINKAVNFVKPKLYRFRKNLIVEGL